MLTLLAVAFADAPDDAAVQALTSKAIGKNVPSKYLCIKRPNLGPGFVGDPTVVAIKAKNQGCKLRGVVVDGKWLGPDKALILARPDWLTLSGADRETVAVSWARSVLLAFEQPIGSMEYKDGVVETQVAYRIPKPQHAAEARTQLVYQTDGSVTRTTQDVSVFKTGLALQVNGLKGISQADATAGLASRGKRFQECMRGAWARDLTLQGRSRLSWDIEGGKAKNLKAKGWGSMPLLQCYSNTIGGIEFGADGHVDYTIAVTRAPSTE